MHRVHRVTKVCIYSFSNLGQNYMKDTITNTKQKAGSACGREVHAPDMECEYSCTWGLRSLFLTSLTRGALTIDGVHPQTETALASAHILLRAMEIAADGDMTLASWRRPPRSI